MHPRDDAPVPVTYAGVKNCLKELSWLILTAGVIGGAIWAGTSWLSGANASHEATAKQDEVLDKVTETLGRVVDQQLRDTETTSQACRDGLIQDRDWCLLKGYPVPPRED